MDLIGKITSKLHGKRKRNCISCGFIYRVEFYDVYGKLKDVWTSENLMPTASLQYIMQASLNGGSQYSSFYIGAYSNSRVPLATDTSANLPEYGEITSFSEGARQLWNKGIINGTTFESSGNPAILTATEAVNVSGVFMSTSSTFGSTGGILVSAFLNGSPKSLDVGETLKIPAGITFLNT